MGFPEGEKDKVRKNDGKGGEFRQPLPNFSGSSLSLKGDFSDFVFVFVENGNLHGRAQRTHDAHAHAHR